MKQQLPFDRTSSWGLVVERGLQPFVSKSYLKGIHKAQQLRKFGRRRE